MHAHTHPFNGPLSRTTRVSRYQNGKTNLDFTEARDSEWQWHQLGHVQVCTLLQTDNHASTPPLIFLQAGCRSCRPTNSVKALKAYICSSFSTSGIASHRFYISRPSACFLIMDKIAFKNKTVPNNGNIYFIHRLNFCSIVFIVLFRSQRLF